MYPPAWPVRASTSSASSVRGAANCGNVRRRPADPAAGVARHGEARRGTRDKDGQRRAHTATAPPNARAVGTASRAQGHLGTLRDGPASRALEPCRFVFSPRPPRARWRCDLSRSPSSRRPRVEPVRNRQPRARRARPGSPRARALGRIRKPAAGRLARAWGCPVWSNRGGPARGIRTPPVSRPPRACEVRSVPLPATLHWASSRA